MRKSNKIMIVAMIKDSSIINSGLGPNPKAIGNGPMKIIPPKPPSGESAVIMKRNPAIIKKKPNMIMK